MRYLNFLVIMIMSIAGKTQEGQKVMFESILLKPYPGKALELIKAVQRHNELYHASDPHKAYLFELLSGPHSGSLFWEMGPLTFSDLDKSMPEGHRTDWEESVASSAREVGKIQYWRRRDDVGYNPANQVVADKILAEFIALRPHGSMDEVLEAIGAVSQVLKKNGSNQARRVYVSELKSQDGVDIMIVYPFEKWADLDNSVGLPADWKSQFEIIHGKGSVATTVHNVMERNTLGSYQQVMLNVEKN